VSRFYDHEASGEFPVSCFLDLPQPQFVIDAASFEVGVTRKWKLQLIMASRSTYVAGVPAEN
jgi:hypothetical protein